jgi:hypothetical protein
MAELVRFLGASTTGRIESKKVRTTIEVHVSKNGK